MPTFSRYIIALARASSLFLPSTLVWPTMQLSSTVMLLKRLNDWNTMPTLVR